MTTFYEFASESPFLTFFLALIVAGVLKTAIRTPFHIWNRYCRSRNIRERGWPPSHLDADGDWKPEPSKD